MNRLYLVIILILIICVIIPLTLFFCPIETNHIGYMDKKIISTEHFNGSYLNDSIIARRRSPAYTVNIHKHLQIKDKNSDWKDFVIGDENFYEDPRVFKTKDNLYPHIIMWTQIKNILNPVAGLYASLLTMTNKVVKKIKLYDTDNPSDIQKNWVLLNSDNLHDTHWSQWLGPEHKVVRVDMLTGEIKKGWTTTSIPKLRGGTPFIEYNNKLYSVCHITKYIPRKISCKFIEIDNQIPYKVRRISKDFTFTKNPRYEFPCGIKYDDEYIYILLGVNDEKLVEIKLKIDDFMKNLYDYSSDYSSTSVIE
jgi:hypothetical protein